MKNWQVGLPDRSAYSVFETSPLDAKGIHSTAPGNFHPPTHCFFHRIYITHLHARPWHAKDDRATSCAANAVNFARAIAVNFAKATAVTFARANVVNFAANFLAWPSRRSRKFVDPIPSRFDCPIRCFMLVRFRVAAGSEYHRYLSRTRARTGEIDDEIRNVAATVFCPREQPCQEAREPRSSADVTMRGAFERRARAARHLIWYFNLSSDHVDRDFNERQMKYFPKILTF